MTAPRRCPGCGVELVPGDDGRLECRSGQHPGEELPRIYWPARNGRVVPGCRDSSAVRRVWQDDEEGRA
ncbi:hypothetical protein [Myxococcus xanthus]|uniref:Uncharacterized protein n=1 Tax=Myxococcus xanthus TaxID=34 RepID=A0A7Y4MNV6_MYXXA|nr:hypothetical protein [Myxococcus xanthus]NOJ77186.1 hypothetical protein [Myxococcus xanthus]NOJ88103.1 hypothetical protein [Myxococcus xanthus]